MSMPQADMYGLVDAMRARLPASARTVGYGHVGDGSACPALLLGCAC